VFSQERLTKKKVPSGGGREGRGGREKAGALLLKRFGVLGEGGETGCGENRVDSLGQGEPQGKAFAVHNREPKNEKFERGTILIFRETTTILKKD